MSTTTQSPVAAAPRDETGTAPLRSYLFLLASRTRFRGDPPLVHYVLEESPERAIEICSQSYPGYRIVVLRDVTDQATAA